jgi:arginase family enzyme
MMVIGGRVSTIGTPSDNGAGTRGASMGPEAMQAEGILEIPISGGSK